jgi:hypothetical protein
MHNWVVILLTDVAIGIGLSSLVPLLRNKGKKKLMQQVFQERHLVAHQTLRIVWPGIPVLKIAIAALPPSGLREIEVDNDDPANIFRLVMF